MASTIVTHHTISLMTVNARSLSQGRTWGSRSTASLIAVTDHCSALASAAGSLSFSRFQSTRHSAEQNRACSRRGVNKAPHWPQPRISPICQCYALHMAGARRHGLNPA